MHPLNWFLRNFWRRNAADSCSSSPHSHPFVSTLLWNLKLKKIFERKRNKWNWRMKNEKSKSHSCDGAINAEQIHFCMFFTHFSSIFFFQWQQPINGFTLWEHFQLPHHRLDHFHSFPFALLEDSFPISGIWLVDKLYTYFVVLNTSTIREPSAS